MSKLLTDTDRQRYRRDGFLFPISVMSAEEAVRYRRELEEAEARFGPLHYVTKPYLLLQFADRLVHHPAILDAVEDIIGPDILLWDSAFIIKEPGDRKYVSWHQDLTYWGLDPDDVASVWLALSPATVESGCMLMLPGSHKVGRVEHRAVPAPDNILSRGQSIGEIAEGSAVHVVLEPGQMSLHHGWTIHASHPNRSRDRRIGLNMNLIAPNVRQTKFVGDSAMLLRGKDRLGHFSDEPRPVRDFDERARSLQIAINARRGLDPTGKAMPGDC